MAELLTLESRVSMGRGRSRKVSDIVKNKADVMALIKSGHNFSDEVLESIGIKRTVHDVRGYYQIVEHEKDKKTYKKDNESLKTVLKEILTIENNGNTGQDNEYDENEVYNIVNEELDDDEFDD